VLWGLQGCRMRCFGGVALPTEPHWQAGGGSASLPSRACLTLSLAHHAHLSSPNSPPPSLSLSCSAMAAPKWSLLAPPRLTGIMTRRSMW
jgi:hypothetical protein